MTTRGDGHSQLAPSTDPRDDLFMAPEPIYGSRANRGRQSVAQKAVDPRARAENNGATYQLRASAQAGRCGEATAIGVGRLYEVRPLKALTLPTTLHWSSK